MLPYLVFLYLGKLSTEKSVVMHQCCGILPSFSMESNNSYNLSNIWRNSILVRDLRRNTMLGTNMLACPDDYALHNRLKLPNAQETTFVKLHP